MSDGLIHIYCGDGKGKTTAATGLAVRCVGNGGTVLFFQFLKDNTSSERKILKNTGGITLVNGLEKMKFVWSMTDEEKQATREFYSTKFKELCDMSDMYDMVVFDEIIPALKYGFIKEKELINFLKNKSCKTEVVMTGRNPSAELIGTADYVTEMKKIKHPFDKGIAARPGVEY